MVFLLSVPQVSAQSERGTISGSITDLTGAAVPGARISIVNKATNVPATTTTNETGSYAVPNLSPGDYSVRVEKEGFKTSSIADIVVNAASSVRADIALEVGAVQQAVEVSSSAIALQTDNARSATVVTNKLVDELPTVVGGAMRSPFDLAILTPESKNFGDNNFQMGGGQMTFVSKSGTNQFHGSAYEFVRNTKLDANDWFANANKNPRRIYKQNDFGGAVGGPVWIPKIYNGRDRTFFFFSYEAFRNRVGASSTFSTVPTDKMYKGDFSKWVNASGAMIPIYDPFSLKTNAAGQQIRDPFPNNQIGTARFDPLSVKALNVF